MRALLLTLALVSLGCASDVRTYMPLEEGNSWQYLVRLDGDDAVQTVKVVRSAPVGNLRGWLLASEMGDSRLAWDGDTLVAAETPDCVYSPPVPLLSRRDVEWRGVVSTPTGKTAGKASLRCRSERLELGGRRFECEKSVLTLVAGDETVQLTTWFFPGMGILRQEQRRGPALTRDRFLEHLGGP